MNMARRIGDAGLQLIRQWEGCRLAAYVDAVGVWTIGYGHTGTVDGTPIAAGMTVTQAKADTLLMEDVQYFANAVDNVNYVPVTRELNDNQRDALISFAFNCGESSLKRLCRGRGVKEIAEHITAYVYGANGVKLQGLVNRRNAELALYRTPGEEKEEAGMGEKRYDSLNEIREEKAVSWAVGTVEKLMNRGFLSGGQEGKLNLSEDMLRLLVIQDRAGNFGN